ncbi:type VI secretion system tube protein Hcp [Sulfuriroseicoccus oceanibius]|uniref:Type VI secretion system tube protein Hcp n=1 Tax=Sulfuriroseicoccus oceanibius TaxID=2707525 RepID=A0A6B3L599_9BACT|nr:type VI secretion system tube protein Hcp [Sulfuriroseicoccus oceanibius]QQL44784.1 type VI secretion system tube protein Hcp [Sulfuriroseicoccus oceanibius]
MKLVLLTLILSLSAILPGEAALDVYMRLLDRSASNSADPTAPESLKKLGFFRLGSLNIGAENTVNIGSISAGGGAGKATFKELHITKYPNQVSTDLFRSLVIGSHYDDVEIIVVYPAAATESTDLYRDCVTMKFELKLVMVQSLDYSVSEGDDIADESVVLQFGAVRISYYTPNEKSNVFTLHSQQSWSRVLNTEAFAVN